MTDDKYIKEALKTESLDIDKILWRVSDEKCIRALHAVLGLATESAELADVFKKHIFYGKEIDWVNVEEELGDIFWYAAILTDVLGKDSFSGSMSKNIEKLAARYKGQTFTEDSALNRNLDVEREILEK